MAYKHLRNARGFFSDYYLGTVFVRGASGRRRKVADRETDKAFERFRRVWERAERLRKSASDVREEFARPFLSQILQFHLGHGQERVHGLWPSAEAESENVPPCALAYTGDWEEVFDNGSRAKDSPANRLAQALTSSSVRYGLMLTGERLRLIRQPGDGPKGAYVELDFIGCLEDEQDERESFAAAYRIFGCWNFLPDESGLIPIERIEKESREHAQKVSEELKKAIFEAAEFLVEGLLADWESQETETRTRSRAALPESEMLTFRNAALTILYRLLFILYAEASDERLQTHEIYRESYSLETMIEEILTVLPHGMPANRFGYWHRLQALFRIYDEGLPRLGPHERIPERGSDFFSRKTAEGQLIEQARLDNSTAAQILLSLSTTAPRTGVGRERVSFRELDIEQLGAVYEGLLEFEPRIAEGTTIEVRVQGKTYALVPDELVRLCEQKSLGLKGDSGIVVGTSAEKLHPELADEEEEEENDELEEEPEEEEEEATEETEDKGVKKGATARLLRRLERGAFHFVPGSARKGSGTFFTPTPLVQDLVRHALGPLIKDKSPAEIESLRILDPAMGSGHFLVGAMRFLGQALHRAYFKENGEKGPPQFQGKWDSDYQASDDEARASGSEARAWCKRRIAERCLFGVDLNPTAVNLARVSLWIESLAGDRPLTYFEHHLRCGNSVLGTWLDKIGSPPLPSLHKNRPGKNELNPFVEKAREHIAEAARQRCLIDRAGDECAVLPESIEEMRFKEDRKKEAENILMSGKLLFDLRSASAFIEEIWFGWSTLLSLAAKDGALLEYTKSCSWWEKFEDLRERERFFHWELEFPEVFLNDNPGFDAVIGNPPWDKVKPDKKEFYGRTDILIRAFVGGELDNRIRDLHALNPGLEKDFDRYSARVKTLAACLTKGGDYAFHSWKIEDKSTGGDPDVFKFFVERAYQLVRKEGYIGFIVPSAMHNNEGCTGLRHLLFDESKVERFYGFENKRKIFPIHSSYKFVSLVFRKGRAENPDFQAAFVRRDLDELADDKPKEWTVWIRKKENERLSPRTLAFLEYRSPMDREIILDMFEGKSLLGDQGPGKWNAEFYSGLHLTNEKDLWTAPKSGRLFAVGGILGFEPKDFQETREKMSEKGFWPVYQDGHIHQFVTEFKPMMRWLSIEAHEHKYGRMPDAGSKLVFRDRARDTDERTCIAAVIPERSCFGNTLTGLHVPGTPLATAAALLNSLVFDYCVRVRIGGQHVKPYLLKECPTPAPNETTLLPDIPTTSVNCSRSTIYDNPCAWESICELEKAAAMLYSLSIDHLSHILSSFPVFARKRPEFFAHLQHRLKECESE